MDSSSPGGRSGRYVVYEVVSLPAERTAIAPDGSEVRVLLSVPERGGLAHFTLGPGQTSVAIRHRTVAEIWYFLAGRGQMWLRTAGHDVGEVFDVSPGTCLAIPVGTEFQFRSLGYEALTAVGATMPPWPGSGEAIVVDGNPHWEPTIEAGPT
jgi:mannose-6-phosphate isomerase-like protein (cupin superfamily)